MSDTFQRQLWQQAQKMQAEMQKIKQEIEKMVVIGTAGAGLVKIHMTGEYTAKRAEIDESLLANPDKQMLEDLVVAAINDAVQKIGKETRGKMASIASGLNLPPGFMPPPSDG
jgi:DNA-binding YbaB/EbfC family protein